MINRKKIGEALNFLGNHPDNTPSREVRLVILEALCIAYDMLEDKDDMVSYGTKPENIETDAKEIADMESPI